MTYKFDIQKSINIATAGNLMSSYSYSYDCFPSTLPKGHPRPQSRAEDAGKNTGPLLRLQLYYSIPENSSNVEQLAFIRISILLGFITHTHTHTHITNVL